MTELRTPRLLLRRARPSDLDSLHTLLSDAEVMRYWSTLPHDDIAQTRAWLDDMIGAPPGHSDDFIIDFQQGELMPGDIFVLSTDGLTAHVTDAEIEAAVVSATPQAACENLLETVLARGGTDHLTIVLVKIGNGRNGQSLRADLSRVEG